MKVVALSVSLYRFLSTFYNYTKSCVNHFLLFSIIFYGTFSFSMALFMSLSGHPFQDIDHNVNEYPNVLDTIQCARTSIVVEVFIDRLFYSK